jgi:hypothetical protein
MNRRWETKLVAAWLILLAGIIAWPYLTNSTTLGDDLTRFTVRVALAYYTLAAARMLLGKWDQLTRLLWTLAWASYLIHLAMAFHHYHHWSHADATAHTEEVSGFGPGIYFSHLFTLLWTMDVAYWWSRPTRYAARAGWIGWALHGFMAFIIFNATIVYETGTIRYAGLAMFLGLGAIGLVARTSKSVTSP